MFWGRRFLQFVCYKYTTIWQDGLPVDLQRPLATDTKRRGVPRLRMPFGHVLDAPALRASGFAPCSPYGGPVFRPCGLRFAPCPRGSSRFAASGFAPILNSAWSSHCAHKLACGTPCFIGLTSACFAHSARPSCAPPTAAQCSGAAHRPRLRRRGVPALRTPFGRVLAPPAASRPLPAHCVCSRLQPLRGLQRPATGTGMHFSRKCKHLLCKKCQK